MSTNLMMQFIITKSVPPVYHNRFILCKQLLMPLDWTYTYKFPEQKQSLNTRCAVGLHNTVTIVLRNNDNDGNNYTYACKLTTSISPSIRDDCTCISTHFSICLQTTVIKVFPVSLIAVAVVIYTAVDKCDWINIIMASTKFFYF